MSIHVIDDAVGVNALQIDGEFPRLACRAVFPTTEWARRSDGAGIQFLGLHEDEVVRTPVGWRFKRRFLHGLTLGRNESFAASRVRPIPPPSLELGQHDWLR